MDAHPRRTAVLAHPDHRLHRGGAVELRPHAERSGVEQPVRLQSEGRAAAAGDRCDHGVRLGLEGLPCRRCTGQLPRLLVGHPDRGCHAHQVDTLWTYELGSKMQTQHALISMAAYDIEWSNLQQQVALPCGFYLQVNGEKARIYGGEIEANGRVTTELQFRVGLGYEHSDITDPGNLALVAVNGPGVQAGSRVSGVPAFTAFAGTVYTRSLTADSQGFMTAD